MAFTVTAGTGVSRVWYDWYTYAGSTVGYILKESGSFSSSKSFSSGYIEVYIDLKQYYSNCNYSDGSVISGNATIYARSYNPPAPKYTLTYNGNNATGGSTASQTGSTSYTVKACGYYKTGYTFQYWQTGSGTKYYPGDRITLSSNTTLYAYWKTNTYTVSYNANGGSGAPSDQTKYYGTTLTLSSTEPTWSGHTFWGWATSSSRTAEVAYEPGDSYTENASITLYAVWVVTATFYSKGSVYSRSTKRIGESVTLPSPANTTTQGCSGWLSNGETYSCGAKITITRDTSFTAIWTNIYQVTFNANGGSNAPASQTKWQDVTLTLTSDKPTWSGHTFLGWSTDSDRNAEIEYHVGGTYTENSGATLYAVWQVSASCYSKGALYSQSFVRIGGKITLPIPINTETEVFTGWLSNGEIYDGGAQITITIDVSFTAQWVAGYKLEYDGNNEDGGSTPSPQLAVTYTIAECGFYKNGYYFVYWRTASGTRYYPGDRLTPTKAMKLYAQWKSKKYFYWHGSDTADATYFAKGKRIDLAVTAPAWNALCAFINEVRTDIRLSTIAFSTVSAGDEISAVKFNIVSNSIRQIVNAGYGTVVPATVSSGDEIVTSLFNGRGSLKDAINKAVDEL